MKVLLDRVLALVGLVFLMPILLITAIYIRYRLGSPVLFRQERPGYMGKPFYMYKFRSMTNETNESGELLPDSQRLTTFGKFLRSTSMDELPALFSVLKGDMSMVGPRPLLMEYLPLYSETQSQRHNVLPGITGWAQINGRNAISWEEKFILDVWYVENRSFALDIKILFLTFKKVFFREGINAAGETTMPKFTSTKS